ncbi:glycosyltransferase [Geobacillus subterraneus]|uniref:glycosyltransferase n=1 Tax=Geobacillus subterraneus TaxID=129338 RepID=UPI002AC89C86|nr:glycosyltransferase [Geobacillus subterraneus]WPZ18248.1 glycosyltransferase [Geobacillus subterraneus]
MKENSSKKLAFFLPSLHEGGVEVVVLNLIKELIKQNYSIDLLLTVKEGRLLDKVPPSVRIINLRSKRALNSLSPLINYLKKEKPDILFSAKTYVNILSIVATKLSRVSTRIVVSEHTILSLNAKNSRSFRGRYLIPLFARIFLRYADEIVAVSEGVASDLVNVFKIPKKCVNTIYNPIVSDELINNAKKEIFIPNQDDEPIILGVGRLTQVKDFKTLIEAFAIVRKKIKARLIIIGDGEERDSLVLLAKKLGIEKYIYLPGYKDNPLPYMSKASVFVLSSKYEGFGNVIVEALACGTSVVSTNCPSGPAEILDHGRYGRLVSVGNKEELAQAIIETLENPFPANELKQRSLDFSIDKSVSKYINLFEKLLNNS